ncbi:MAG: TetR/AcrR family transcriptional regulator [Solirubrobacteraceae bacterium]
MSASVDRPTSSGGRGARRRILAAARVLFARQGINATGVAELCVAAHVSKRTLYQHFAGKDEVVVAYLMALADDPESAPEAVLARDDLVPRARLLELFDALAADTPPMRGCPFINAGVEIADPRHPGHRFASEHKRRFTQRLAGLAREAGARSPERVGRRLALLYDGAAAEVVLYDSPEPAAEAQMLAAAVLRDAID